MTRIGIAARLAVQVAAFAVLAPVQFVALRSGSALARTVPVLFHRLFLWLFDVRVVARGAPPSPGTPTLVLSNHVSWLDIAVVSSLCPLSFIAKQEVAAWPVFGTFARMQRCVFLDRSRKAATASVNETVAKRLAAGDVIVLFPEGTTNDGNRLLPFRSSLVGAARAAISSPDAPRIFLQSLAITYLRRNGLPVTRRERPDIAWYGDMELVPHLGIFVRGGPLDVVVTWGEPLPFEATSDRKEATARAEGEVRLAVRRATAG